MNDLRGLAALEEFNRAEDPRRVEARNKLYEQLRREGDEIARAFRERAKRMRPTPKDFDR